MTDTHLHEQPGLVTPETQLRRATDDLTARFAGIFTRDAVEAEVREAYAQLRSTATITTHLATLTIRSAKARLAAKADSAATRAGSPSV